MSSTILEALAVIKGKDETGGAFDAVAQKIGRIARAANSLNRDVQKQMNVAATAERQIGRLERTSRAIGTGAKMAAGGLAAYEASRAATAIAERTARVAVDRAHEETRMRAAGMTEHELAEANDLAADISKKYPALSQTSMLHMARNVRSIVGTYEEATKVLDPLAQLKVVAMGAHPEKAEELEEDFDKLAKGMEIKGVTQHEAQFKHYMDGMAKAINVFGDTLRPTDYYEMFQYGRAATNALSDDFMLATAPTIAQEFKGGGAGKAMSGFHSQFVGGIMKHYAVKQLADLGMIDMSKVEFNKVGDVKRVKPNFMKVGAEFLRHGHEDPYHWTQAAVEYLHGKGKTDEQIQQLFTSISSREQVAQLLNTFFLQKARVEKDWGLIGGAKGLDAAQLFLHNDPKVAQKAIGAQIDNYLGNTAAPFMPAATGGMNWLASGFSYMSERAKKDPKRSAAELGFFGAMAAALGIDMSSTGLSNAGSLFRGEGLSGFKLGMSKATAMLAPILDIATRPDVLDARGRRGYRYDDAKFARLQTLDDADNAAGIYGDKDFEAEAHARYAKERAAIEAELSEKGYGPAGVPGRGMPASSFDVQDIQRAVGIGGTAEPVKAVVEGNATLDATVTVKPSSEFWATVEQKISNAINAFRSSNTPASGTSGSTGRSMPEAGAAP